MPEAGLIGRGGGERFAAIVGGGVVMHKAGGREQRTAFGSGPQNLCYDRYCEEEVAPSWPTRGPVVRLGPVGPVVRRTATIPVVRLGPVDAGFLLA